MNLIKAYMTPAEVVRAVDGVTLTARTGEFVCIHGASGSGKSTLLNLLSGLDVPDDGTVTIGGVDLSDASEDERAKIRLSAVGVVFQHDNLIEEFTVAENVGFPMELCGRGGAGLEEESARWLARVGMDGYTTRFPHELSGGQQQRVGIARALVGNRRILIADEPTGALDSSNSESLYVLLRELADDGVTVVVSSHDPAIRRYATRTLHMVDGRLAAEG